MNIDELQQEKEILEDQLEDLIGSEIEKFRQKTGVSVRYISIDFSDKTAYGDRRKMYILNEVSCEIAF